MRLFLGFLLVFLVLGLFSTHLRWWGYVAAVAVAAAVAGLYTVSAAVWS
jgi:hypothetical protein